MNKRREAAPINNTSALISEKLEEGDVRGAIRLASSDDSMAPHDEKTLAELRLKHPPRRTVPIDGPLPLITQTSSNQPIAVQERDVIEAIKSFPAGSAGGVDGLRPQHLKDMTSAHTGEAGQRIICRLTEFVNLCLAGKIPPFIQPVFCGASLCALNKKDGGLRPIAVGTTLRR